ncbi:gag/pol/env polyprotein, putative [Perkinsus marinus ATCC 50983]|uniref:Gag/pol/env polyprotein, putative n=1 Tax=Perkinsus marinus (strain ATCC 50983 / TXsc) TaxID=423536 RepID=C5KRY9_PERM5|nr:gag/pol/env polyprotein, putative [Perkinsus marinus ATCC 50983]EER12830.1 gag/pol/env polyprotein, putative [Perkinsus marinus ATCC 50983]|eukprot:XP_002781035.1 gag/pol/env polyprotein, putative [Perkinsus marinus ATCC 50983]
MQNVLARLGRDPLKLAAYQKAVKELLASGAVEVMKSDENPEEFASFYTPLTPVIDETRVSTKCRLCLDARPLNTYTELRGVEDPSVVPKSLDLYASIIRWRSMRRVSCEDLQKAFWQVEVKSDDRPFLGMILDSNTIVRWVRVPFGCGWSPWALSYGIQVAMNDVVDTMARSSLDYYVDDSCISSSSKADVERSRSIIIPALALRGFVTNPEKRAHNLDTCGNVIGVGAFVEDVLASTTHSWLGYRWYVDDSVDVVDIRLPDFDLPTTLSMSILRSTVARLFDPLGLWNEVVLELRVLLRGLHDQGFGIRKGGVIIKDLLVGEAEVHARSCIDSILNTIEGCNNYLRSNRYLPPRYIDMSDIVCFCDASDLAVATDCRDRKQGQRIFSRLSTHVGGTIPRRELEAVRIGILSVEQLSSAIGHRVPIRRCVIASDSLVSLYRIRSILLLKDSSKSKFDKVGKPEQRRLIHIYDLVHRILTENNDMVLEFRHVSSSQNVADRLTRPSSLLCDEDHKWQSISNVLDGSSIMCFNVSLDDLQEDGCPFLVQGDDIDEDCLELFSPPSPACNAVTIEENSSWFAEFRKRVLVCQSADPECVHLASLLRANPSCSQSRFHHLDEETGMLLIRQFKDDGPDCWVAKVPEGSSLQEEVIEKIHKEYIHPGIKKTVRLIRRHCDFKGLHTAVKRYIRACDVCCRAREGRMIVKGFATAKLVAPVIFGVVGLDLYGPLRLKGSIKVWLLVMVCYVSKWMAVKILEVPDVDHVLASSMELFYESGVPNMVLTDQGSVFTASRYRQFLAEHSIMHTYTFPYEETRRGWLERPHKEIGVMLRCLQVESGSKLEDLNINELRMWVCRLCYVHNNMAFDEDANDKELTPWLCNRVTRSLDDVLSPLQDEDLEKIRGWLSSGLCLDDCYNLLDSATKELHELWSTSVEHMKELWLERRSEVRKRLARHRKRDMLKIGDIVWRRNMPVKKLGELFSGPFEVIGRDGSTIKIKDVNSGDQLSCPVEMLKRGRRGRARPIVESFMKDAAVQAAEDGPDKVINPDDVARLAKTLVNDSGVMTRSERVVRRNVSWNLYQGLLIRIR